MPLHESPFPTSTLSSGTINASKCSIWNGKAKAKFFNNIRNVYATVFEFFRFIIIPIRMDERLRKTNSRYRDPHAKLWHINWWMGWKCSVNVRIVISHCCFHLLATKCGNELRKRRTMHVFKSILCLLCKCISGFKRFCLYAHPYVRLALWFFSICFSFGMPYMLAYNMTLCMQTMHQSII